MAVQAYGDTLESLRRGELAHMGSLAVVVEQVRPGSRSGALFKVREISDRDAASALRGVEVFVPRERLAELEQGEYYGHDLIGLHVQNEQEEDLGELVEVFNHGAHDIYRIEGTGGEKLLPATREVIRSIDLEAGIMIVRLLEST